MQSWKMCHQICTRSSHSTGKNLQQIIKARTDYKKEAENLLFLQKYSQVRTPKLYAAFIHESPLKPLNTESPLNTRQCYYLITEFIEGDTLTEELWLGLGDEAQKTICSRLSEQFQLLRLIPSEGYYGRVYHQGWNPWLNLARIRGKEMCGPYYTYEDLISAMYDTAELRMADTNHAPEYHRIHLELLSVFKSTFVKTEGHRPVLTHLDPKWENIIVRPIKEDGDGGEIKDWDVVLIDWDTLIWLPAFMQVAALDSRILLDDEPKKTFNQRVFANFEDSYPTEREFLNQLESDTCYSVL